MEQWPFVDRENPTHSTSREGVRWSRANEKGTHPGVCTPLNWSIWGERGECAVRRGNHLLGVLTGTECAPARRVGDRVWSIFYGRVAANVDTWRWLSARTLGRSASASEATNFGLAGEPREADAARPRHWVSALRMSEQALRLPGRMRSLRARSHRFWRESVETADVASGSRVLQQFERALVDFEAADVLHIVTAMLAGIANDALGALAEEAGRPELQGEVLAGLPNLEEHATSLALWRVSRGEVELADFLARHGFHGPAEGEVSKRSWREDAGPLRGLLESLSELDPERAPDRLEHERAARGRAAEADLLRALPRGRRTRAQLLLAATRRLFPFREVGKACLILHLDAARACARRLGVEHVAEGRLEDVSDVFFLLDDEIAQRDDLASRAARRRARQLEFEGLDLPETWTGMPNPEPLSVVATPAHSDAELEGLGVGGGRVEGRVVVVEDPGAFADDFGPGDVLVAESTDPSWAPFFLVAGAVVMDAGSAISHAAIVAREMGIPAVVATGDATRRLRTGWRVRVDGDRGCVEILARD